MHTFTISFTSRLAALGATHETGLSPLEAQNALVDYCTGLDAPCCPVACAEHILLVAEEWGNCTIHREDWTLVVQVVEPDLN